MKNSRILEEMHSTMHDLHTSRIVDKKTMWFSFNIIKHY